MRNIMLQKIVSKKVCFKKFINCSKCLRDNISKLRTKSGRSKKVAQKYFKTYHTPVFGVEKHEFGVRFSIRLNHTKIRGYAL